MHVCGHGSGFTPVGLPDAGEGACCYGAAEYGPEEDMGWHHAVEVCLAPGCDWRRARDVAELAPGYTEACIG